MAMTLKNKLRNWLQLKASGAQPIISMQSLGQAAWTPRNYEQFSKEGYQKNVIVFKAINELVTSAEQAAWSVQRRVNGKWQDDDSSDLTKLLSRPNPEQSTAAFFGMLVGYYAIAGNSYIEAVKPSPGRPPRELHMLRPDRTKVLVGDNGPRGYEYTVGAQKKIWLATENAIRHIKTFNPLDDWYGMSPMEAAAFDIDIHNATLAWNKALLDNSAKPSGALVYAPKRESAADTLSDEQYARLKQQIDELYSGAQNAGRPMLLEGGLRWIALSLSPSDMDYINSKNTAARDICTAWGVPPQLLGIPGDNTYSNMKEARLALWEQKILPLLYKIRDELNAWLAPQFTGGEYRIALDEDAIVALAPRREEQWRKLQDSTFLTINEKREALGYEPIAGGDTLYIPATQLPIGSSPFDSTPPTPASEEDESAAEDGQ